LVATDANGDWSISNAKVGLSLSNSDQRSNNLANTLRGQLIPATIKVAGVITDTTQAYLAASLISDTFEQNLKAVASIIQRDTQLLVELSSAVGDTESSMSLLKDVFAEDIFRQPIKSADALIKSSGETTVAIQSMQRTFQILQDLTSEASLAISEDLVRAMDRGQDGAALFDARIEQSAKGIKRAEKFNLEFVKSLEEIKKQGGTTKLGFATTKFETLTKQRLALEKLAQALSGLVAFRDKLEASQKGEIIFKRDREEAEKFFSVVKNIVPTITDINLGGSKATIIKGLKGLFESIKLQSAKIADPILAGVVSNFGTAIEEAIDSAGSEAGDATTRTLSNVLFKDLQRFTKESEGLLVSFLQSMSEFGNKNAQQLDQAITITEKRLSELSQATRDGSFLPDFSGEDIDILKQNFARIRVVAAKQRALLEADLKPLKEEFAGLVDVTEDFKTKNALGTTVDQNVDNLKRLTSVQTEIATAEERIAKTKNQERGVTASFIQNFQASLELVNNAGKQLFATQSALSEAQASLVSKQAEFADSEIFGFENRIALIESESSAIQQLARDAAGLGDLDVDKIAAKLTQLTADLVQKRRDRADSSTIKIIEDRISKEQQLLEVVKDINSKRITSLQKELDLINQQGDAIRSLGDEFLKSNDTQQKQIIDSARLVEKFFGSLTSDALNSGEFKSTAARFLTETNDEMRNAVLTQLERLKNVGGEVAPGVQAGQVLRQLSESVVGALFKSPQQVILDKQLEIQTRILSVIKDTNAIAEVQSRLAALNNNALRQSIDALVRQGAQGSLDANDETIKIARGLQEQLSGGQKEVAAINVKRTKSEQDYSVAAGQAAIRNKALVSTFSRLDTSTGETQQSAEEYQEKLVELRDAFIKAEDDFIDAQDAYNEAARSVTEALTKVSVAQADYAIQLELAHRESINVTGGFVTFRDELLFLQNVFNKQINALKIVGAAEEEIADLRVKLAQETLTVIEGQLQGFRDNAERLFAGGADVAASFEQNFARAQFAANQAREVGITSGGNVTNAQAQALFERLQVLPSEVKQGILDGLRSAPPGATFGGLGAKEIENAIIAGAGGGVGGDTILELEKQAAQQRQIIAENSIGSLVSARQSVVTAFEQLTTAQEQLQESRAQKDLAQLQLDTAVDGFESTVRAIDFVAENLNILDSTMRAGLSSLQGASAVSAARGTLSGSEVAGLLNAASREKSSMPVGSKLGVFNTSESVLTKSQMNRLRQGVSTPNAAEGTAVVTSDVLSFLQQISQKLSLLNIQGVKQNFQIDINNQRNVTVEGLAGLQTALQNIVNDRTGGLYTREEAQALQSIVMTVVQKMQQNGQLSAIGT
jgi:hypothetical protein